MARKVVRRTQAIVPFGVGATVEFQNEALMAAGLDVWPRDPECRITDERLAKLLNVQYFRQPPPPPQRGSGVQGAYLPFVRFPQWHYCPRCRAMRQLKWNAATVPKCNAKDAPRWLKKGPCAQLPKKSRPRLIPVSLVAVCREGHISDFPWIEWAHRKQGQLVRPGLGCEAPRLRLNFTGRAGLVGQMVRCEACGDARALTHATMPHALSKFPCTGERPWLGPSGTHTCASPDNRRVVHRSESNVYFAEVASSILIPPYSMKARQLIDDQRNWDMLTRRTGDVSQIDEGALAFFAEQQRVDLQELKAAIDLKTSSTALSELGEHDFRNDENAVFADKDSYADDDLVFRSVLGSEYGEPVSRVFEKVVLVEKLAETRALTGFSRLDSILKHEDPTCPPCAMRPPRRWISVPRGCSIPPRASLPSPSRQM